MKVEVIMNNRVKIDDDNPSIQRIEERCIDCGVCLNTCNIETGLEKKCRTEDEKSCLYCGQCILSCPMGALKERYEYKRVLNLLNDTDKKIAISYAPAVRVSLCEELNIKSDIPIEELMPAIMRKLGFTYVFDVSYGADVTIIEEANELLERLSNKNNLPMFTSCCPSWVRYVTNFRPELVPNLSTTKSPIEIISTLIKTYFKEMESIEEDIISVVVAPCTAKKYEATTGNTDYVITTRELAFMIKESKIDLQSLKPSKPDELLSEHSKSGLLFGKSGGVMSAALSTVHYLLTGKNPKIGSYDLDIKEPISKKSFKIGDRTINIAVVYGLKNLETILAEKEQYDFIEVMSCKNGCIGGGGQPLVPKKDEDNRIMDRKNSLTCIPKLSNYCHENTAVIEMYNSYFTGYSSQKAKELLHYKHSNKN